MRLVPTFHLSYPEARAVRVAAALGAVAGLVVIAACSDAGSKSITAPTSIRNATIGSGGFGQAKNLTLCVAASSPTGTYTFVNTKLNRSLLQGGVFPGDGFGAALTGNGFFNGSGWFDPGDGGDGSAVANAAQGTPYTLSIVHGTAPTVGNGGCVVVLNRTVGNSDFMASLPISLGGPCNPATSSCGGVNDSFSAATITFQSGPGVYDHTDCLLDDGVLIPEQANPPGTFETWGNSGLSFDHLSPSTYICDNHNNPTRGFVNYEHGATLTFAFTEGQSTGVIAPTATTCEDYAKGTSATLSDILVGFKGLDVNSVSPGVFFYYAKVTKGAGDVVAITQTVNPNPAALPPYDINQTQAYLYTFNGSKCTTVVTLSLTNGGATASGGGSLPAGNYILGVKYATDAPKGTTVASSALRTSGALLATHNYEATVNGGAVATTTASVDTKTK